MTLYIIIKTLTDYFVLFSMLIQVWYRVSSTLGSSKSVESRVEYYWDLCGATIDEIALAYLRRNQLFPEASRDFTINIDRRSETYYVVTLNVYGSLNDLD